MILPHTSPQSVPHERIVKLSIEHRRVETLLQLAAPAMHIQNPSEILSIIGNPFITFKSQKMF